MRCFPAAILLLALAACQDKPATRISGPEIPNNAISDATRGGGNPHFYFKPPMVGSVAYGGVFDETLAPTVVICEWEEVSGACVGDPIATFSMEAGRGSEIIRVEPDQEQYIVNWHTGKYPVDDNKVYRLRVLVGNYELGYADVEPWVSRGEVKNLDTNEYVPLKDGATLPIKFRIEQGALPGGADLPLSAGPFHGCGIVQGGAAYCWGDNHYGQLGDGTLTSSTVPVAVLGGHTFIQVVNAFYHTCALDDTGKAYCWGRGGIGNLGTGNLSASTEPVPVTGGHTFVQLTAGAHHTCGLRTDGTIWCWGYGERGALGNGSNSQRASPVQAQDVDLYQQIDAGRYATCGVTTGGIGKCWGDDRLRQLGYESPTGFSNVPLPVDGDHRYSEVHIGYYAGCGLRLDGETLCWGYNGIGGLGQGTQTFESMGPVVVTGGLSFATISVGTAHACGLLPDRTAYCWGSNNNAELGINAISYLSSVPVAVMGMDKWAYLQAGDHTTCGVTTAGVGKCWGYNHLGQTGTDSGLYEVYSPMEIAGGYTFAMP